MPMPDALGVVLFDDPATHTHGWAQASRGAPFRIASTAELATDTTWWTNLDAAVYDRSGLVHSPRFRPADFWVTPMRPLLSEFDSYLSDPHRKLDDLLHLFHYGVYATTLLGLDELPAPRVTRGFRAQWLGRAERGRRSQLERDALDEATQPYTFCEMPPWRRDDRVVTVFRHRPSHGTALLQAPVPKGAFEPLPLALVPRTEAQLMAFARPLLVRVTLPRFDPAVAPLLNHGAGAAPLIRHGRALKNHHQWVSTPEYRLLIRHADVVVHDALAAAGWAPNPIPVPDITVRQSLSPAFGLAFEALWSAATARLDNGLDRSALSVWLQALDRAACFETALTLTERLPHVVIQMYGRGQITLRHPDRDQKLAGRLAWALNDTDWLVPMMQDQPVRRELSAHAGAAEILRSLYLHGDRSALKALDKKLLAPESSAEGVAHAVN